MKLNIEQRKIIESKPNGHMLVRGVAGSGKTTVAVHKIPFLLKHYCPADEDRILVVTFNKSLINYVKYIYDEIKEYNIENQIALEDMYSLNREDKLEIKTIDSIMYRYFMIYKNQNNIKWLCFKIVLKMDIFEIIVYNIYISKFRRLLYAKYKVYINRYTNIAIKSN